MQILYKGTWYKEGETISIGMFLPENWIIKSINSDCSCVLERKGKTKVMLGSVKGIPTPEYSRTLAEFNNWMNYIHREVK